MSEYNPPAFPQPNTVPGISTRLYVMTELAAGRIAKAGSPVGGSVLEPWASEIANVADALIREDRRRDQ